MRIGGNRDGRVSSQSGQVAILFAMVFTFMFILFAFVVDFGHLVNNKINLQIAADTAAYAGAAWQARTLNQIGALNYRIRQDLKELAMRVHVTHTRHNRNFPAGDGFIKGGDDLARGYFPFICQQAHGYVSRSGVRYDPQTNLCRNAAPETGGLPPIVVPPVIAAFDPFAVAIQAQIKRIQQIANNECRAAANDNRQLANHLVRTYTSRAEFHRNQAHALEKWINDVSRESPQNSTHPIVKAALESARRNLSFSNRSDFKFEILTPTGNEYIRLNDYRTRASLFFYDFSVQGDGCVGIPSFLDFESVTGTPMVAGVEKNLSIMTYFAVKVSSKPTMLFMPQKWVEEAFPTLEAFAAAKPFGSRIGPHGTTDQLLPVPNRPGNANRMINFSFKPNDRFGIMNTKITALFDRLHPLNSAFRPDGNQDTGWPDPDKSNELRAALQLIRAPTQFDALFYSVFPDPGGNIQDDYLEADYAMALYPDYMEAAGTDNNLIGIPQPRTPAYLPAQVGSRTPGWIQINSDPSGLGGDYGGYAEEQPGSHSVTGVAQFQELKGNEASFGFANRELIHSGWTANAPTGGLRPGRIGYSVKMVPMIGLMRTFQIVSESGGGSIANKPTGDPNLSKILH